MSRIFHSRCVRLGFTWLVLISLGLQFVSVSQAAAPATAGILPAARAAAPQTRLAGTNNIISIPETAKGITVDGVCEQEYGSGVIKDFTDGNGSQGKVYLIANADLLYICMAAQLGSNSPRFGRVYLDPQADGANYVFADQGDDAFQVEITPKGTRSSYIGTSVPNGWSANTGLDALWDGFASVDAAGESIEYALQIHALGVGSACSTFGISVFHHWFAGTGDDYRWLDTSIFDQPRTWQLARIGSPNCPSGDIAYVFRQNSVSALSFYNLLTGAGYGVDLIPLTDVVTTNFAVYKMIIVADDTGSLNDWGSSTPATLSPLQVDALKSPNIPILGLGEGGYAFFGKLALFLGWPNGWHGPQDVMNRAATAPLTVFPLAWDPITYMAAPANSVGIYLNPNQPLPADVTPVGLENPTKDHSTLIVQGCRTLWGNGGNPLEMSADGKPLFLNTVAYTHALKCGNPTTPPKDCVLVSKTADPAAGTPVAPGTVITYTITYTLSDAVNCANPTNAKLVDAIPADTLYVPNSASDGISPAADGALVWLVPQGSGLTKTFQVTVSDTVCNGQQTINNTAMLLASGIAPVTSAVVSHPAACDPVLFPNHNPMFAEDELTIEPYPLVLGHASEVRVRLQNSSAVAQPVTVEFQTSAQKFGIGLPYTTFATQTATLLPFANLILRTNYVPAFAGLACFQVKVTGPNLPSPLMTQSCIDNMEDFTLTGSDDLTFKVGNPLSTVRDIFLVVDNTCPGWSATIIDPADGTLHTVGGSYSDMRNVTLRVTSPTPASLGSGCHIDVQAWIGSQLIGGVRKVDVPPVHLPANITPPWEEREIIFVPDPPVLGSPGQLCVELGNPLATPKTVSLEFDEADFGAGIGFTPIQPAQNFLLPANSYNRYCINWTPPVTGTLHRCILVKLNQAGYAEMHSQRNVTIIRTTAAGIGSLSIPVTIGNPSMFDHTLGFDYTVSGINPYWHPQIVDDFGIPADGTLILAGQTRHLFLRFGSGFGAPGILAAPPNFQAGGESQVAVGVLFDGEPASGFTISLVTNVFLPTVRR